MCNNHSLITEGWLIKSKTIALIVLLSLALGSGGPALAASSMSICENPNAETCPPSERKFLKTFSSFLNVRIVKPEGDKIGNISQGTAFIKSIFKKLNKTYKKNKIKFKFKSLKVLPTRRVSFRQFVLQSVPNDSLEVLVDDGNLIEDFFGSGSARNVLGFAGPRTIITVFGDQFFINNAHAVINSFLARSGSEEGLREDFSAVFQHEFSHAVGLDHTAYDQGKLGDAVNRIPFNLSNVPLMFPFAIGQSKLILDDVSSMLSSYPSRQSLKRYGSLVVDLGSDPDYFNGYMMVIRNVKDPENLVIAAPANLKGDGKAYFDAVPPGQYIIGSEALDPAFTEGSSVGTHNPPSEVDPSKEGYRTGRGVELLGKNTDPKDVIDLLSSSDLIKVQAGQEELFFF